MPTKETTKGLVVKEVIIFCFVLIIGGKLKTCFLKTPNFVYKKRNIYGYFIENDIILHKINIFGTVIIECS